MSREVWSAVVPAMRSLPHLSVNDSAPGPAWSGGLADDRAAAEAELGPAHPLVGLLGNLQTSVAQMWVVAAIAVFGSAVRLAGSPRPPVALLVGACAAEIILSARWLIKRAVLRETCLELLAEGHRGADIRVLDRERRRLVEAHHRIELACWITGLVEAAERPQPRALGPPVFAANVVRTLAPELRGIAEQLVAATPSAQGLALVERLLHDGVSPLYGSEVEPLRRQLGRARYLLEDRSETPPRSPRPSGSGWAYLSGDGSAAGLLRRRR